MLADELDYVIGVDTHRDEPVLAAVTAPAGAVVAGEVVRADAGGYRQALRCAARYAPGRRAWAIEGTGSYGAGLGRYLAEHGEAVLEVSRSPRADRRLRGKTDPLDAARTARVALAGDTCALPRAGGWREAVRLLLIARRSAIDVRREGLAQLRGVIVTAPDRLRESYAGCRPGNCSIAAAGCAARAQRAPTGSRPGSCSAASPAASQRQHSKPTSLSANSSPTCGHSRQGCSTSPAWGRSSPRS